MTEEQAEERLRERGMRFIRLKKYTPEGDIAVIEYTVTQTLGTALVQRVGWWLTWQEAYAKVMDEVPF